MIKAQEWGSNPQFFGPRHAYREDLLCQELSNHAISGEKGSNAKILDIGAGNASLSERMEKEGYEVSAIDESIKFCQSNTFPTAYGSITSIPAENETFDAFMCSEVLEHVPDHERAVDELYRVLKPGGAGIISVPAHPWLWDKSDEWAGHKRRYTKLNLQYLLMSAGFKVVSIKSWGFPTVLLYHKLIYLGMLKQSNKAKGKKSSIIQIIAYHLFHIDELFRWVPLGIGYICVVKKPKEES